MMTTTTAQGVTGTTTTTAPVDMDPVGATVQARIKDIRD